VNGPDNLFTLTPCLPAGNPLPAREREYILGEFKSWSE